MFGLKKDEKREDDDTFAKRIRAVIEDSPCATSGIRVYEHDDENALDSQEQEILARLKAAHEKWNAEHKDVDSSKEDVYKSVKVKI